MFVKSVRKFVLVKLLYIRYKKNMEYRIKTIIFAMLLSTDYFPSHDMSFLLHYISQIIIFEQFYFILFTKYLLQYRKLIIFEQLYFILLAKFIL